MPEMGLNRTVIVASSGLLLLVFAVYFFWQKKASAYEQKVSGAVEVVKTWNLPNELDEVSGIAFLGNERIAAVQDEDGIIFIYDLNSSEIVKQIKFGGSGDYEGIAINENTAYILESNGDLYVVENFLKDLKVSRMESKLRSKMNMEGLALDKENNRLLLAVKSGDKSSGDFKAVYALDLASMELQEEPALKMTFEEDIFDDIRKKSAKKTFYPSEIARNPATGEIYLLEAESPRLLIMNASGKAKALHHLSKEEFPQPEGLTFDGEKMYISNEGNPATIHQVLIK